MLDRRHFLSSVALAPLAAAAALIVPPAPTIAVGPEDRMIICGPDFLRMFKEELAKQHCRDIEHAIFFGMS